jgi:hypothetical protein
MAPSTPRRPGGARSTRNTIAVVNSPPIATPWKTRRKVRMTGAAKPIVA